MKDDRKDENLFNLAWDLPPAQARRLRRNMLFMINLLLLSGVLLLMGM